MKLRVLYWVVGVSLAGFLYWQQRQEQRRIQLHLQLLEATVQVANERAAAAAANTLHDMQQAIKRNQNQPQDLLLLHQTEVLFQRAAQESKRIESVRRALLKGKTGKPEASEQAKKAASSFITYVKQLLVQPCASAEGVDASNSQTMARFMVPVDERLVRLHSFTSDQSQLRNVFSRPSLAETLALLAQKEAVIRNYELMALAFQSQKIGCGRNIIFDKLGAFAAAESNTVSAGETYKAELFLTASNAKAASQMTVNGKPIAIGPSGHGQVEFKVPADAAKAQPTQAYWTGTIRALVNGRDSTFKVKVAYTIRPNEAKPAHRGTNQQ